MKVGLVQQQVTKLALTKELRQSITLLQYTSYELSHYLTDLSLENPFVKLKDTVYKTMNKSSKPYEKELASSEEIDLQSHLKSQLDMHNIDEAFKKRILFLIHRMDDDGYIREEITDLSLQSPFSEEEIGEALNFIQQELEPVGIGAQSLQQSLALQLKRTYPTHIIAHKLVEHYFIQLAEKKWEWIAKELNLSIEQIQEAFEIVQTLNPRPAGTFKKLDIPYIIPDLIVEKGRDGYQVIPNDRAHISFTIDNEYLQLKSESEDKESLEYLKAKYKEARWVMNSIEQRKRTMVLVTKAILLKQRMFFEYGLSFLQPLTLKEIADDVELHESTISRAVTGKYIQTPIGVYELKFFFHSKVKSTYNKEISSVRVKEFLKQMIAHEEKKKPLSDQQLADRLKEEHKLQISRRTVAKYRDQLRIPSSSARKLF